MISLRFLFIVSAAALLTACAGCAPSPEDAVTTTNELTPAVARAAIENASEFRVATSTLHVLERRMQPGVDQGLWSFRRWTTEDGKHATEINVAPAVNSWLDAAKYNVGGVVRFHLAEPVERRIIDIDAPRNIGAPLMSEVEFRWEYEGVPDEMAEVKPELRAGPYRGVALLQYRDDGWKVIGDVRNYGVPL